MIYVSTNCFRTRDLEQIIRLCRRHGILHVELSSVERCDQGLERLLCNAQDDGFQFLVHNYFPPPEVPFVLNLASQDHEVLRRSEQLCRDAIDIGAKLGAPMYSVHAGFCFDARPEQLGNPVESFELYAREEAIQTFVASVRRVASWAAAKNMRLAIENHVLAPFHLVDGRNELLLGVTADELLELLTAIDCPNVGLLIDLGHLNVSATTLSFSRCDFLRATLPRALCLHLSDNDGRVDQHTCLSADTWFFGCQSTVDFFTGSGEKSSDSPRFSALAGHDFEGARADFLDGSGEKSSDSPRFSALAGHDFEGAHAGCPTPLTSVLEVEPVEPEVLGQQLLLINENMKIRV